MRKQLLQVITQSPRTTTQVLQTLFPYKEHTKNKRKQILYYFSKLEKENKVISTRNSKTGEKTFTLQHNPNKEQVFTQTQLDLQHLQQAKNQQIVHLTSSYMPDATQQNIPSQDLTTYNIQQNLPSQQSPYRTILSPLHLFTQYKQKIISIYKNAPRTTNIIHTWTPTKKTHNVLQAVCKAAQKYNKKLYLLNTQHTEPYTIGKKGTYPLQYTQQTATIDVQKLLTTQTFSTFRNVARQTLIHITKRLRKTRPQKEIAIPIRLWNYIPKPQQTPFTTLKNLIESTKQILEKTAEIGNTENRHLQIPLHIKPYILPSFGSSVPPYFTQRNYKKRQCLGLNDLQQNWQDHLRFREQTALLFNNKDRCRIFRKNQDLHTVPNELHYIQTTYNIPLICYDFRNISKNQNLTTYFQKRGVQNDT